MMKLLVPIFLLFYTQASIAQGNAGTVSGTALVYSIQSLEIRQLSGVISFNSPNDFFNGVTVPNYANFKVKSNENWLLSFASRSTYFSALSKSASTDMPCSVLAIKISGRKNFRPLKTNTRKLIQGNRGSKSSRHDFNIDVNLDPGFGYNGGLYSISVLYTLTKQ